MSPSPPRSAVELIRAKRDGAELSAEEIRSLIESYLATLVPDEQMAAMLMAICWRGLTDDELQAWTGAMIDSGTRLDLSRLSRPSVDKHSTGGVGDKVSLVLVPLLAACGAAVPQLSGRGLGHTGGTLDKMESIPGWRADLNPDEVLRQLEEVGCVICAAGSSLAPADRRLYALRDVTGTVESIPLIASSIMSKKVAEGTGGLLLDVKVGKGAFMREIDSARQLAQAMIEVGARYGVRTGAVLTAMDAPLGRAVGNALELAEARELLDGGGPADLRELILQEAQEMLDLAQVRADPKAALDEGRAAQTFRAMVRAQGGDPDIPLPEGKVLATVTASADGFVQTLDAMAVGTAAWRLGAGRARPGDPVSAVAGVLCLAKPGEPVTRGQPVFQIRGDDPTRVPGALAALDGAIEVAGNPPPTQSLLLERIGPSR